MKTLFLIPIVIILIMIPFLLRQPTHVAGQDSLPDGLIAYVGADNNSFRILDLNTHQEFQLPISYPNPNQSCPTFSPNGQYLSYFRSNPDTGTDDLVLLDLERNQTDVLVDGIDGSYAWSPNSSQIAFNYSFEWDFTNEDIGFIYEQPPGVRLIDVASRETDFFFESPTGNPLWVEGWSPDGTHITLREPHYIEGSQPLRVLNLNGEYFEWQPVPGSYRWLPDSSQIVYDLGSYGPYDGTIHIANPDGTEHRLILDNLVFLIDSVSVSPNGDLIIFYAYIGIDDYPPNDLSMWRINLDGTDLQRLPYYPYRAWSPDGTHLLVEDDSISKIIDLDGNVKAVLDTDIGYCVQWLSADLSQTILTSLSTITESQPISIPTATPSSIQPSPFPTLRTYCSDSLLPRLSIGDLVTVLPGPPNNIREEPAVNSARIGQIPSGANLTVIDGYVCGDGFTWWKVDYDGLIGWTVESDNTDYWLEPIPRG